MLDTDEIKGIGVAAGLVLANIAIIWALLFTPLSAVNELVFQYLIVGMIFYGILLTVGSYLGRQGVKNENMNRALIGVALLQLAYGMFGAGLLRLLGSTNSSLIVLVFGITAAVTLGITILAGLVVYGTGKSFRKWDRYSTYCFMAALGAGFIGSFSGIFGLITFVLVLLGFLLELVYEIWHMKTNPEKFYLNGLGIYIAFMGVFVQILRIVIEMFLRDQIE